MFLSPLESLMLTAQCLNQPLIHKQTHRTLLGLKSFDWFGFLWFYGISTTIAYSMPNPVFTYIPEI